MKKSLTVICLLAIISFRSYGQIDVPLIELSSLGFTGEDSTKNFIVLNAPDYSKEQLFKIVHSYLNTVYKNPKAALSTSEGESIVVNGFTNSIKGGLDWYEYPMEYKIIYQFKDGKIKFEPSITSLEEIWSENKPARKIYVRNTDSPNDVEINCIYMKAKDTPYYFLFKEDLKNSIDRWIKYEVTTLVEAIKAEDW
tara:strand:+ start:447 stop:1034 length:588 start_codon:yes stop_codon:yes gene_type:complete